MGVRIYRKIENHMQQGRANARGWILEYDDPQHVRADPLTGWSGSGDTQGQVSIRFPTKESAIAYAERHGLDFHVFEPGPHRLRIQTYASNFQRDFGT